MVSSLSHPLGLGTAAAGLAASHRSITDQLNTTADSQGTEVDVSNAFVSLGLLEKACALPRHHRGDLPPGRPSSACAPATAPLWR